MKDRMALLVIVNAVLQRRGMWLLKKKNGLCGACAGPYMLVVVEAVCEVRYLGVEESRIIIVHLIARQGRGLSSRASSGGIRLESFWAFFFRTCDRWMDDQPLRLYQYYNCEISLISDYFY